MRVASGPESSRGGCGRMARLPTRLGPSPENTTSRSGCSARDRAALASARLKISPGLSFWDMVENVSAPVDRLEGSAGDLRQHLVADVGVGPHALDVVVVLQGA